MSSRLLVTMLQQMFEVTSTRFQEVCATDRQQRRRSLSLKPVKAASGTSLPGKARQLPIEKRVREKGKYIVP